MQLVLHFDVCVLFFNLLFFVLFLFQLPPRRYTALTREISSLPNGDIQFFQGRYPAVPREIPSSPQADIQLSQQRYTAFTREISSCLNGDIQLSQKRYPVSPMETPSFHKTDIQFSQRKRDISSLSLSPSEISPTKPWTSEVFRLRKIHHKSCKLLAADYQQQSTSSTLLAAEY